MDFSIVKKPFPTNLKQKLLPLNLSNVAQKCIFLHFLEQSGLEQSRKDKSAKFPKFIMKFVNIDRKGVIIIQILL